jgi:transposase
VDHGDGSHDVYGLDLRSSAAACGRREGAHPLMLRAIAAAKKKNDHIDARKICDCLRSDFLPECYMASTAIRERRRTLRYRNLLVRQMAQMKIKISTLLMAAGVSYNKQRLHKAGYFCELLATNPDIDEGLRSLLRLCRETVVRLQKTESALVPSLESDSLLMDRVERLMTIPAVGPITALTWALEVEDVQRFSSIKKATSYCGLCGAEKRSGSSVQRTPLSKQRNKHLQTTLIEAGKTAPRNSPELAMLYVDETKIIPEGIRAIKTAFTPGLCFDRTEDRAVGWCAHALVTCAGRKKHSGQPEVPRMTAILPFHPYLPHLLRPEDAERPRGAVQSLNSCFLRNETRV